MKQSKLLKKSLAALLAILMVAAMIPMSAFAADPDKILVDGEETTLSEAGYSVDLAYPSDTVKAKLSALEIKLESMTGTKVAIFGANGQQQGDSLQGLPSLSTAKRAVDLTTKAVTKPETGYFGTYTLELRVTEAGAAEPAVRTLTINVTERAKSTDTTIAKVTGDKVISADINNTDKVITIVKPIGVTDENMTGITYTATDKGTGVYTAKDGDTVATGIGSVWVRAESGATQQYTVKTVIEDIFTDFTVPNMVEKKVTITHSDPTPTPSGTPSTYDQISIDIKVPYGTDLTKIIPTYTVSDSVKNITVGGKTAYDRGDDGDPKQSSGVAAFDFSDPNDGVSFVVTTDKGTGNVIVTITEAKNTAAELSSVQVGDFTPTEVERTNQTVYVTDSTPDTAFGENTTEDVVLNVSEGSTVTITSDITGWTDAKKTIDDSASKNDDGTTPIDGQAGVNDGIVKFSNLPVGKFSKTALKLVVTSKDGKTNSSYNLTFAATPTTKAPVITGMTLIDGENNEYKSDSNGVITVPYDTENVDDWTVRVDVDGGATVVSVQPPYAAGANNTPPAVEVAHKDDNGNEAAIENGSTFENVIDYDVRTTPDPSNAGALEFGDVVLHAYWGGHTCFTKASGGADAGPGASKATTPAKDLLYDAENKPVIRNEAFEKRFTIKKAKASASNTVDSIKLTTVSDISAVNEKNTFTGIIDQDNKLVRINVPADFKDTSKLFILDYSSDAKELQDKDSAKAEKLVASTLGNQAEGQNAIKPLATMAAGGVFTADQAAAADFDPKTTTVTFKSVAENNSTRTYQLYAVKAKASAACTLNGITSETAGVKVELDESIANSNRYIITVPASFNTKTYEKGVTPEFDLKFDISEGATLNNWAGPDITEKKFAVAGEKLFWNGAAVTGNTMTVTAENGSSSNNYTFIIKVAEPETDATLKSIKVGETEATAEESAYTAVIADDTADLTKQILTIETTSPVAKVQIDGKDFDKAKTYDVSKEVKITVTAEDGTTKNEYTLIATIKPKNNDATLTGVSVDGTAATIAEEAITAEAEDPANITLELTLPEGATAKVGETEYTAGMTVDATEAVTIVVTAEDGTEKTYTLTVSKKSSEPTPSPSPKPGLDDVNDVEANDWFAEYVANVLERGIMSADSKGNFRPGEKVTRSQFAVMMCNLNGVNPDEYANAENPYTDVKKDGWDFKWIMAAVANDWMSGTSSTTFEPGSYVTREQTALIIAKSQGLSKVTEPKELYSDDAQIASWAKGWVYACKEAGLMGYMSQSQKTFAPKGDLTRAQMATILSGIEAPSTPENPDDGNNPENPDEGNNPENPDEGNNPENPDEGNNPENPDEGNNPENPDEGNNPENPDEGNNPENPDEGNTPETPDEGSNPETPDEGSTGGDNTTGGETVAE